MVYYKLSLDNSIQSGFVVQYLKNYCAGSYTIIFAGGGGGGGGGDFVEPLKPKPLS